MMYEYSYALQRFTSSSHAPLPRRLLTNFLVTSPTLQFSLVSAYSKFLVLSPCYDDLTHYLM